MQPTSAVAGASKPRPLVVATAILLTLALTAGGAEAIARLVRVKVLRVEHAAYNTWAQPDPVLGWRNRPGSHPSHEGTHERMTFLSDGSRVTGASADGKTPVLLIGCSFVAGYGVKDEETFAAEIQRRRPGLRVMNFGVPGYGTYQSLLLLRELLEKRGVRPKAVIYGYLPMHAERNVLTYSMLEAYRSYGGERFSMPHVEMRDNQLAGFPPFVVPNWPLEEKSAVVSLLHSTVLKAKLRGREQYEAAATRLLLKRMKDVSEQAGARFLVATLWYDGGQPGPDVERRIRDGMRSDGIEEIDAIYRGPETRLEKLLVGGTGHFGPIVHSWWADKIDGWLVQAKIAQ